MNAECQTGERRVFYRYEEIDETLSPDAVEILPTTRDAEEAGPDSEAVEIKDGFWRRQFSGKVTAKQRGFDWVFGVILPVICFTFDPVVFRGGRGYGQPLFAGFAMFAYLLAIASVIAMAAWLLLGDRLKWLNGLFSGLFFAGSIISLLVGILLVPYSLMGMVILIGFLGFTPFFSAIVYSRSAVRAMRASEPFFDTETLTYVAMLTGIFSLVLPWLVNQAGK